MKCPPTQLPTHLTKTIIFQSYKMNHSENKHLKASKADLGKYYPFSINQYFLDRIFRCKILVLLMPLPEGVCLLLSSYILLNWLHSIQIFHRTIYFFFGKWADQSIRKQELTEVLII